MVEYAAVLQQEDSAAKSVKTRRLASGTGLELIVLVPADLYRLDKILSPFCQTLI